MELYIVVRAECKRVDVTILTLWVRLIEVHIGWNYAVFKSKNTFYDTRDAGGTFTVTNIWFYLYNISVMYVNSGSLITDRSNECLVASEELSNNRNLRCISHSSACSMAFKERRVCDLVDSRNPVCLLNQTLLGC